MKRFALPTFALLGAFVLGACSDAVTSPDLASPDAASERRAPAPSQSSIVDIVAASVAAEDPEFTLLNAAIGYIVETNPGSALIAGLLDNDQYTVFAPTDAAFGNLVGAVAGLLDPNVLDKDGPFAAIDDLLGAGTIEAVVSYHVAEGRRAANSVVPPVRSPRARTIETLLAGATFDVTSAGEIIAVGNTASIVIPNVSASNGIVHVIDAVILPIDLGL